MSACCHNTDCDKAPDRDELAREARTWLRLGMAGLLAAQAMIFSLAVNLSPVSGNAHTVIHGALALSALGVFLLAGLPILRESWTAARHGRIVFEQFFLAGIAGAFAASVHSSLTGEGHVYYEIVAVLVAIYTFGTLLARRRRDALRDSISKLGAAFDFCERLDSRGNAERIAVEQVAAGDQILAGAGQGVPVDGVVMEGTALVSEAALTGEPYPVVKRTGDTILAGSRLEDSSLRIRATSAGRSRRLDQLLQSIDEARRHPGRIQREADRLVAWFLPLVMLVAAVTTAAWTLHSGWVTGIFNGLAVLLVACPCAMGLATPVAIWGALAALAKRGLIARGGDAIEALSAVDTTVFDKTGTLSESDARLVDFVCLPGTDRTTLLREIAAIQTGSTHPIARAFRTAAPEESPLLAHGIGILPGTGIEGGLPDNTVLQIGNKTLLAPEDRPAELRDLLAVDVSGGHEIFIRRNGRLCGLAVLRESLRDSARAALAEMKNLGLRTIVMTGDREENAARFGFSECLAGMTPDGKLQEVENLKRRGDRVLFIGDGINDAPAMAAADTSIALAAGSELPRETAAMELNGHDLRAIPQSIALCRATVRAIRRNIAFAACYNIVGIALAAAGLLHPIAAALIMLVSSMTVTWRVLRETSDAALEKSAANTHAAPRTARPARSFPRIESIVYASALALQGPAIAWLGGFHGTQGAGFIALFLAAGAALLLWSRDRVWTAPARMTIAMFSVGGLTMLAGWWADAGFAAVVRDGVCLCGCAKSNMGLGLLVKFTWMDAGMLAAALPALFIDRSVARRFSIRFWCWGAGLAGMFAGMELGALALAGLPVTAPSAQFFLTYAAMVCGMCLGMLAGCEISSKLLSLPARRRFRHNPTVTSP
ncbi:MAG: cation-translocating P-type ATPase [Chthoniobacterales bacterium]|nr:cation-translocating P-type ATPase [Chthoniobacterales bacterium]